MSPNRHIIESKWVFKKKRYGLFRARLFAQGYTQITRVYFTNNYSPVVTDAKIRIILLMWLIKKWDSHTIDSKPAFLYALIEEGIYTNIPKGMAELLEEHYMFKDILILIDYIYDCIQVAGCWFR